MEIVIAIAGLLLLALAEFWAYDRIRKSGQKLGWIKTIMLSLLGIAVFLAIVFFIFLLDS